jgi:hypothetical protein
VGRALPCQCCHRLVEVSCDQFDVFEHMHYVYPLRILARLGRSRPRTHSGPTGSAIWEWQAVRVDTDTLARDNDTFSYPMIGRQELSAMVSKHPMGDEVSAGSRAARTDCSARGIAGLIDALQ